MTMPSDTCPDCGAYGGDGAIRSTAPPVCPRCGTHLEGRLVIGTPDSGVAAGPDSFYLVAGGRELLRVPSGVTAEELRAAGFPDVAAALEGRGSR